LTCRRTVTLAGVLLVALCASLHAAPPAAAPPGQEGSDSDFATIPSAADELLVAPAEEPFLSPPDRPVLTWKDRFASGRDKVAVDIFQPAGMGRFPVIVLLHGAGPRKADKHYQRLAESLAEHGYLSLYVHYYDRGRRGRGSRSQWGQAISDALTFASSLDSADPDRMGLVGYSLGAFLALGKAPEDQRVRAVVAYYGGISNGEPAEEARSMPPALLFHGTADRVVSVRRSVQAFETLRQEGRPVDLVVYPGARHGFCLNGRAGADGRAAEDSWARALDFFSRHLQRRDTEAVAQRPAPRPEATVEAGCPAMDPLPGLPSYLTAPRPGVESTVALINPDADTVFSLVPPRPSRARGHRASRSAATVRSASVKLPAKIASR
jgi:carboxymethylenebutenolidase